jgi:Helix-turn-helix domain
VHSWAAEHITVKSQAQHGSESDSFTIRNESARQSPAAGHPDSIRSGSPAPQLEREHFVDASIAAEYLHCSRKHILRLSRLGVIPAHPISFGRRVNWRYLLSELHGWVLSNRAPVYVAGTSLSGRRMAGGSPRKGGR